MKAAVLAALIVVLPAALLESCASHVLSIRTVPAQTPAADNAAAAASAAAFAEAVAAESATGPAHKLEDAPPLVTPADAPPMYTYDPWERLNRFTYRFNARFARAAGVAGGAGLALRPRRRTRGTPCIHVNSFQYEAISPGLGSMPVRRSLT